MRQVRRKQKNPQPNKTDFTKEDERIGQNLDTFLKDGLTEEAQHARLNTMQEYGQLEFTKEGRSVRKEKQEKYLTIEGLLGHPYFTEIANLDIPAIIDEYEKLTQGYE